MINDNYHYKYKQRELATVYPIPECVKVTPNDIINAWQNATSEFGIFNLSYPIVTYDESLECAVDVDSYTSIALNFFYFPENLPSDKVQWYIEYGMLHHELARYHICPYDTLTFYEFLSVVNEYYPNTAMNFKIGVVNYFVDLIIDFQLLKMLGNDYFNARMWWYRWVDVLIKRKEAEHSGLWQIMVGVFEYQKIKKVFQFDNEITEYIRKVHKLLSKHISWSLMLKTLCGTLSKFFLRELDSESTATMTWDKSMNKMNYTDGIAPTDITMTCGNPFVTKLNDEVTNTDHGREMEKVTKYLMQKYKGKGHKGYPSFVKTLSDLGIADSIYSANRLWFRYQAKDSVKYKPKSFRNSSDEFDRVAPWNWSNPISQLNLVKSINTNPIYPFPPYARKYAYRKGEYGAETEDYLDALIVIDSSSSMEELSLYKVETPFDYAVVSSLAVLHAVYSKNVKFNVINFSYRSMTTGWLEPTSFNLELAEKMLLRNLGNVTIFPSEEVRKAVTANRDCVVIIITDGDLHNWDELFKLLETTRIKLFLFSIQKDKSEKSEYVTLREKGARVFFVTDVSTLSELVINTAGSLWS